MLPILTYDTDPAANFNKARKAFLYFIPIFILTVLLCWYTYGLWGAVISFILLAVCSGIEYLNALKLSKSNLSPEKCSKYYHNGKKLHKILIGVSIVLLILVLFQIYKKR